MNRLDVSAEIRRVGILPAVRVSSTDDAIFAAYELSQGGIPIIEVTVTDTKSIDAIAQLVRRNDDVVVGAGEVIHLDVARQCCEAGAMFLTSPGFDRDVVEYAREHETFVFPGALTPTEVMAAWRAGSDFVKIFPCANIGGPRYIRALKTPFPDVPMIASGGVNLETAADFIRAGADALGIGTALVPRESIHLRQASRIRNLAARYCAIIEESRKEAEMVRPKEHKK